VQDDGAAEARDVLVLDVGGARGHDDGRGDLEVPRRVRDALRVVSCAVSSNATSEYSKCMRTSAARNHALPPVLGVQVCHLVVRAPQLEAEDRLQVLALEQHIALEPVAQVGCVCEGRLLDDFVDAGGEDEAQVVGVAIGQQKGLWHDTVEFRPRRRAGVRRVFRQREARVSGCARRAEAIGAIIGRRRTRIVRNSRHCSHVVEEGTFVDESPVQH
jgi:hypothetical protein